MTIEGCKEQLSLLRNNCTIPEEETLKYYCECMLKLERTFYKIDRTHMLSYIKQILLPVFPLMVEYFCDRAEAYKNEESEIKKIMILEDIESSVVKFWEVHEAIIQSSNGVDKILFQSAPIDTGQRYAAPKICAFYSELLNSLASIFVQDNKDIGHYAFCVYPTMNSQAEAILLFSTMKKRGKVGIIHIPGKRIADVRYMISLLLHEFFHVIPGRLRARKKRARLFLNVLLYDLEDTLMGELDFYGSSVEDDKKRLQQYLFGELVNVIIEEIENKEVEDRFFYSEEIVRDYVRKIRKHLWELKDRQLSDMVRNVFPNLENGKFSDYCKKREIVKEWYFKINGHISSVLSGPYIQKKCRFYMGVFREAYSDLLAVITLGLSPEEYLSVFRYTKQDIDHELKRIGLFLRGFFVMETMKARSIDMKEQKREELFQVQNDWDVGSFEENQGSGLVRGIRKVWEIYYDKIKWKRVDEIQEKVNGQMPQLVVDVVPNKVILTRYLEYFKMCQDSYEEFMTLHKDMFEKFSKAFLIDKHMDSEEFAYQISIRMWEKDTEF